MKHSKYFWILFLALGISIYSCGGKTGSDTESKKDSTKGNADANQVQEQKKSELVEIPKVDGWETYSDEDGTFQYPKSWEMKTPGPGGARFTLFSPQSKSKMIKNNMNLRSEDAGGYALREYIDLSLKSISSTTELQNIKIEKNEMGSKFGIDYGDLSYSGEYSGTKLKWLQRISIVEGKAYIFTFTCAPEDFNKIESTVNSIFDTFQAK